VTARGRAASAAPWPTLALQAWSLGAEASWVIWLRCALLAEGGTEATSEAYSMVAEKWQAQADLTAALATGRFGTDPQHIVERTIGHYGARVRANRSRLTR
jgi:hypothetical protein